VPFRTVFLHAMVRDEKGEKMSKTRGNVIDPLDITAKHGADALRFTLASMAGQGRDIKLSTERIVGYRAFANKIWNAARFVLMNAEGYDPKAKPASVYDRWIVSRFQRCADDTREALENFQLSDAANRIYQFIWGELCDWAIELSKPALYGDKTPQERAGAQAALLTALEGALRLLHPFMPFVTEEIWQRLPNKTGETIMLAPFPPKNDALIDVQAEKELDLLARAIDGARSVRGEVNIPPNQKVPLLLFAKDQLLFRRHERAFQHLANATEVTLRGFDAPRPKNAAVHVEAEVEVHLPLAGLIDFAAEKARVEKELSRIDGELQGIDKRLSNKGFVERAPKEVVEKDRARAEELGAKREKLARHLARVTSVEAGMEEKNPQHPHPQSENSAPEQNRSLDQMGTHGGPAQTAQAHAEHAHADHTHAAPTHGEHSHAHSHEGVEHEHAHTHEEDLDESDEEPGEISEPLAAAEQIVEAVAERAIAKVKSIAKAIKSAATPAKKAAPKAKPVAKKAAPAKKAAKKVAKPAKKAAAKKAAPKKAAKKMAAKAKKGAAKKAAKKPAAKAAKKGAKKAARKGKK
jgi:valyl-tRNA synthetase